MGGAALGHAQNRFFETFEERIEQASDIEEVASIYHQCVERLTMMCADEIALDNFSKKIAVEDSSVEFPGDGPLDQEAH